MELEVNFSAFVNDKNDRLEHQQQHGGLCLSPEEIDTFLGLRGLRRLSVFDGCPSFLEERHAPFSFLFNQCYISYLLRADNTASNRPPCLPP